MSPKDLGLDRSTTTITTDASLGRAIRGRVAVVGANGATPAAGARVLLTGRAIPETLSTITDEHGDYSFKLLEDGVYTVTIFHSSVVLRRGGLRVTASTSSVVDAHLDEDEVWLPSELLDPLRLPLRATADPT